jgi:hypothetical protein
MRSSISPLRILNFRLPLVHLILILSFLSFASCEDTKFSSPGFQADLNYELWIADSFSASYNDAGELVITATNNIETVELTLTSDNVGSIDLGPDFNSKAEFIDGFGTVFSTAVVPDEEVSIYRELGVVEITSRNTSTNTITGNFYFQAYDADGRNPMGLSNGVFFQIAISN